MGKMWPGAKLPITDPPNVWVSGFPSVDGNIKLVSAIMENGKNGRSSPKHVLEQNFQLPTPLKFISPHESVPRAKVFILPHESPMCSFTLPNIENGDRLFDRQIGFRIHSHRQC